MLRITFFPVRIQTASPRVIFQGPYSPIILTVERSWSCSPDWSILAAFECNRTSDWLNHMFYPIRRSVSFKCTKFWRKRQRMFLRMDAEYQPKISCIVQYDSTVQTRKTNCYQNLVQER